MRLPQNLSTNHPSAVLNYSNVDYNEIFFKELDAPRLSKHILITISVILSVLCIFGYLGIIWFERFGSDLKRICINKILSSLCWTIILWFILVHPMTLFLYSYRPVPEFFCFYLLFLNQTLVLECILFFDAIIIVRFVLIFCLKSPQNFYDDFWYCFINIVTVISR